MQVNPVGFGGIPIQRLSPRESDKVIKKALDLGINFFDTSRIYTDSEEKFGRVFSQYPRDKYYIASKTFDRDPVKAAADLEKGLELLKVDYFDLYQVHNIRDEKELETMLAPGGVLEVLQKAREQGKIKSIGVTGHKPPVVLKALKSFPFDTVQVPINYIERASMEELIPYAKEKGIGVIAMKPVAGGAFKHVVLNFRFILTNGADVIIPGMDDPRQVEENLSTLDHLQPLSDEEIALLEKEKEELGTEFCRRCEYCMPCPHGLPIAFLHVLKAYYFRYDLKDWVLGRLGALPAVYKDCTACGECVEKCPYDLDMPKIFNETHLQIEADRKS